MVDTPRPLNKVFKVINCSSCERRVSKVVLVKEDGCLVANENQIDWVIGVAHDDGKDKPRGRKEGLTTVKIVGVLTAGTGSALMSAAVLQARMSLMEGVVKLTEAVMDGIMMLTTVACLFYPTKHTHLSIRQKGVPPMFLKL